jgi:hypothetical protein
MTSTASAISLTEFERVHVSELPDDGVRVQIDHRAEASWGLPAFLIIIGLLFGIFGWKI